MGREELEEEVRRLRTELRQAHHETANVRDRLQRTQDLKNAGYARFEEKIRNLKGQLQEERDDHQRTKDALAAAERAAPGGQGLDDARAALAREKLAHRRTRIKLFKLNEQMEQGQELYHELINHMRIKYEGRKWLCSRST